MQGIVSSASGTFWESPTDLLVGPCQSQNSGASGRIDLPLDLTSLPTPTSNFADGLRVDFQ